jgi:hypothetical protein
MNGLLEKPAQDACNFVQKLRRTNYKAKQAQSAALLQVPLDIRVVTKIHFPRVVQLAINNISGS